MLKEIICKAIGVVTELGFATSPYTSPYSKAGGAGAELFCESADKIGKHIVKKIENEIVTTKNQHPIKFKNMCYPDLRQQRNIDSIKLRNNLNKFRATKPTYKDRIERNARFADWHSNYKSSQRLLLT